MRLQAESDAFLSENSENPTEDKKNRVQNHYKQLFMSGFKMQLEVIECSEWK